MKKKQLISRAAVCLWAVALLAVTACQREIEKRDNPAQNAAHKETPTSNIINKAAGGIGYLDEGNQFVPVSENALKAFFRHILHLPDDMGLQDHTLLEQYDPGQQNYVYAIKMISADQTLRIGMEVQPYAGGYIVNAGTAGTTCTCKTVSCSSNWGCDSEVIGGACKCSPCTGDCEKTTTTTSSLSIRAFFHQYMIAHHD